MAVAGGKHGKEPFFGDEMSTNTVVRDLQRRFPEIPAEVVSSLLKKNGGNMSRCIEELEHTSQLYMYGDRPGNETPGYAGGTVNNYGASSDWPSPRYPPADVPRDYQHPINYFPERGKPSYTSYVSLETGVSELETPTNLRQNPLDEHLRHVSSCQVDIHKPMRTLSTPQGNTGYSVPGQRSTGEEALHRQASSPPEWTTIPPPNRFEQTLNLQEFPFEPRPAWEENPHPGQPYPSRGDKVGVSTPHIIRSDPPKPSSPSRPPRKYKHNPSSPFAATFSKATESITLTPNILTTFAQDGSGDSPMPEDGSPPHHNWTSSDLKEDDPVPPKRGIKSKQTALQSKEKEDQAYTEALLMHQRARYERLCKEFEDERNRLTVMREEINRFEQDVANKRNHRSPFPTQEEISLLREQKRQLQIDIECMNREIETYKSQGLMDIVTAGSSFYENMGSTGPPGPVPPINHHSSTIHEPEILTPPPPYESLECQLWSCSACTLLNHPALDKCECCEMPRDK